MWWKIRPFSGKYHVKFGHSLTAARNLLWVVYSAPHVDRSSARAHASAAVSPVSRTIWLIHVVRNWLHGWVHPCMSPWTHPWMSPSMTSWMMSSSGAIPIMVWCLQTWNPRQASEPCVLLYYRANDECGRRWSDGERLWYWVCLADSCCRHFGHFVNFHTYIFW